MMNFDLSNTSGTSTMQPKLSAWEIHDVVLKSIKYDEFAGKKDPSAVYKTLKVRFENENGYHEETVFMPKEGDEKRMSTQFGESPSPFERFKFFLAHLGEQLSPDKYNEFKGKKYNLPAESKKLAEDFIEIMTPAIGKATKLKLIGNKKGESCLPYFVSINKNGDAYLSNNFLGNKVFFTSAEERMQKNINKAVPTQMEDKPETENVDLDFDIDEDI